MKGQSPGAFGSATILELTSICPLTTAIIGSPGSRQSGRLKNATGTEACHVTASYLASIQPCAPPCPPD
jgi:hypothetical protein